MEWQEEREIDDESVLIRRSQDGDATAYEQLVRAYQDVAFRTALIITRNVTDAEDSTQSAFLNAWLAIARFRPHAPFRPWLLRIVANEAKNKRLATNRRQRHLLPEDHADLLPGTDSSPEYLVASGETSSWLLGHLDRLRDDDRIVILCRHVLILSEAETAEVLGCPRGTVKSRLHRALGRLRTAIEADPIGEVV